MPQNPIYVPTRIPLPSIAYSMTISTTIDCTILNGGSIGTTIDMSLPERQGYLPLLVVIPAAWTSAKLTIQISTSGVNNWKTLHHWFCNKSYTTDHTVAADDAIIIDDHPLRGIPYFRFLSGTTSAPVNQTGDRTLTVYCGTH